MKWILKLLLDERGFDPFLTGGLIVGGGALLGGLLGKNKQQTIDPYAGLRGQYQEYLSGRLGKRTPYTYNPAFELPQPEIEKQTEATISERLANLPSVRTDIQDISNRYYEAQKAQKQARFDEEQRSQKDVYNRLGLASSTPYLSARDDLVRKQGLEFDVLEADIARQGIDQEMKSRALAEEIANMYLSQGQQLGQLQREYFRFPIEMSMADIERMTQEELAYAGLAGSLLGGNPPEYYFEPNIWSQLGTTAQNIGTNIISDDLGGLSDEELMRILRGEI